jgi:filamentous hemagglutinin
LERTILDARVTAMMVGNVADIALAGMSPRGAIGRKPAPVNRRMVVDPGMKQPPIRLSETNSQGQARGGYATIEEPMMGTGTEASRRITTPGWSGHGTRFDEARGHLIANSLGGRGDDPRNLVTLTQKGANHPEMSNFERAVTRKVRSGEVVEYSAIPLYSAGHLAPSAVLVTARDSRGGFDARLIANPAGRKQ